MSEWKTVRLGDVCGGSLPLAPTSLVATPSAGATPATPPILSHGFVRS